MRFRITGFSRYRFLDKPSSLLTPKAPEAKATTENAEAGLPVHSGQRVARCRGRIAVNVDYAIHPHQVL